MRISEVIAMNKRADDACYTGKVKSPNFLYWHGRKVGEVSELVYTIAGKSSKDRPFYLKQSRRAGAQARRYLKFAIDG